MICDYQTCGLDATRCVRTKWSDTRHERHYGVCPIHFESAREGEKLTLSLVGYGPGTIIPCPDHEAPLQERNTMDEDIENDEDIVESKPARRKPVRGGKKSAKKKTSPAAALPKVDPEQALAFVRSRIRDEKDPIVKALYQRELTGLEERVKKIAEERRANRYITTDDKQKAKLGDRLWLFENGGERWRGGRHVFEPPVLHEVILKDVLDPEYQGGKKRAVITFVGKGGQKTLGGYSSLDLYADPRAAVDRALKGVDEEIKDAQEQLDTCNQHRDALLHLRKAAGALASRDASTAPAASANDVGNDAETRSRKRWSDDENRILAAKVASGKSPEEIAADLGRTRDRVVRQMHKLGIKPPATPFRDFGRVERRDDVREHGDDAASTNGELEGQQSMFEGEPVGTHA